MLPRQRQDSSDCGSIMGNLSNVANSSGKLLDVSDCVAEKGVQGQDDSASTASSCTKSSWTGSEASFDAHLRADAEHAENSYSECEVVDPKNVVSHVTNELSKERHRIQLRLDRVAKRLWLNPLNCLPVVDKIPGRQDAVEEQHVVGEQGEKDHEGEDTESILKRRICKLEEELVQRTRECHELHYQVDKWKAVAIGHGVVRKIGSQSSISSTLGNESIGAEESKTPVTKRPHSAATDCRNEDQNVLEPKGRSVLWPQAKQVGKTKQRHVRFAEHPTVEIIEASSENGLCALTRHSSSTHSTKGFPKSSLDCDHGKDETWSTSQVLAPPVRNLSSILPPFLNFESSFQTQGSSPGFGQTQIPLQLQTTSVSMTHFSTQFSGSSIFDTSISQPESKQGTPFKTDELHFTSKPMKAILSSSKEFIWPFSLSTITHNLSSAT